ncbi:MAG: sigma-54-dependent Fis family transcriptional regulator [bacterium]|nr:sigma-54-dependent Fis family transcriptional regulator [bacterium]
MERILVVDDEKNMCMILKMLLEKDGYAVVTANSGKEAIEYLLKGEVIDLIISDLKMTDVDGMGVLKFLRSTKREIPLVLITAYGSIESAVEAMKQGAADFITKPFNKDVIRHIVRRIFRIESLQEENTLLKDTIREGDLVYRSQAMHSIMETVKKVAVVPSPVLIVGESGTGKGVIAKAIHALGNPAGGKTRQRPFVRINCPSIPETLLQSELFGYQKGAFTGASRDFKGKIRLAEGGTLFLDEIGDLPYSIQPKLLRLLEEKSFEPLGSTTTIKVNTKIICATNQDLKTLMKEKLFRKDLFYRINTITIDVPPLRERPEDIIPVSEIFLANAAKEMRKTVKTLSDEVKNAFMAYPWPGNVRELLNVMERAVVLSNSDLISLQDIPMEFHEIGLTSFAEGENKLVKTEKMLLLEALQKCEWNISGAARALGISRSTLRYRMSKYKLKEGG